jgi:hypothetical protein
MVVIIQGGGFPKRKSLTLIQGSIPGGKVRWALFTAKI